MIQQMLHQRFTNIKIRLHSDVNYLQLSTKLQIYKTKFYKWCEEVLTLNTNTNITQKLNEEDSWKEVN